MPQTKSNHADLFSTDDRIRIKALNAISPKKSPFQVIDALGKLDPKWNPSQAQLVVAIHGVTQLVMWLTEAEKRFPSFDLTIHYQFDEDGDLQGVTYFKPKLGAPYVRIDDDCFFPEYISHFYGDNVAEEIQRAFKDAKHEKNSEVFRTDKNFNRYTQSDLEHWGCRESLQHKTLRECLREMGGKF